MVTIQSKYLVLCKGIERFMFLGPSLKNLFGGGAAVSPCHSVFAAHIPHI